MTGVKFRDNEHVLHVIEKIVSPIGRRIDEASPMVDARLPDGSRVNAVIPPLALKGPTITIRKFSKEPFTINDLIRFGTLTPEMAVFLDACVKVKLNIVVSGGTGSGKTTTLNVLSSFIPPDERIVTIEDAAELQLRQEHVVSMETRPANIEGKGAVTMRDLVRNALRMRPDRIVVGEVRGGEALDMLQAMNTGHDGSLTTGHANSPRDMLTRLETMVLMAGMELPAKAIREQIASAVDLIVQQSRLKDGSRRITYITEVQGMEGEVVTLQDVFVFEQKGVDETGRIFGKLKPTGIKPKFFEKFDVSGIKLPIDLFANH
jgi:pilus assembly protein CpaF